MNLSHLPRSSSATLLRSAERFTPKEAKHATGIITGTRARARNADRGTGASQARFLGHVDDERGEERSSAAARRWRWRRRRRRTGPRGTDHGQADGDRVVYHERGPAGAGDADLRNRWQPQ